MNRDRLADSIEDDEESMMNSVAVVDSLIEKEVTEQGIHEDRIVIGGFSQGCVVTTLSSLILKRRLAGLIALSGWLALSHKIEEVGTASYRRSKRRAHDHLSHLAPTS